MCKNLQIGNYVICKNFCINNNNNLDICNLMVNTISKIIERVDDINILIELDLKRNERVEHAFASLASIINKIKNTERIGVVINTTNIYVAGCNIDTKESLETIINQFDKIIKLKYLNAIYLGNECMNFEHNLMVFFGII